MEPNSQVKIIDAQIRESYGRVTWTHKTHEKCTDIISQRHSRIKISQIVLSALTTTGVLVAVFGENETVGFITAILSAVLFGINSFVKGHDLGEISQKHADAASDLWDIREKYLSLLTDIRAEILSIDEIRKERKALHEQLSGIYKGSPRTISKAYNEASKALKIKEELTFSDDEINKFLPPEIRKSEE